MTTNDSDSRPSAQPGTARPEPGFDELIVEEESYAPPPRRDDAAQDEVPVEVLPPEGGRPDVPRDLDGEPTDFEPLRTPVVDAADDADDDADDEAARWQQIQVRFVDDPAAAVSEAADLVEHAVSRLRAGQDAAAAGDPTEQLRLAFRRYRAIHELVTRPDVP